MKKALLLITLLFLAVCPISVTGAEDGKEMWVVIVAGQDYTPPYTLFDSYYCYYVMTAKFGIDPYSNIQYLYWQPNMEIEVDSVDNATTKQNVQWTINEWLASRSDDDDLVFMYFRCHGGGFNCTFNQTSGEPLLEGGRIDGIQGDTDPFDEGYEHQYPLNETQFGVDESLWLRGIGENTESYWDDELKQDLNNVTYDKLIILLQACVAENHTCFSGGFIDDLSAPNRIIITAANETSYSYIDRDDDGLSEFSEGFFDALYGFNTEVDMTGVWTHLDEPINADSNNDGNVSMWEAFQYAWDNDDARLDGDETPWLDDNGNGWPTYENESDVLDETDGLFSYETYLGFDPIRSVDINGDHLVDIFDKVKVGSAFGATYNATDGKYWHQPPDYPGPCSYCPHDPNADLYNDHIIDIYDKVIVGGILFGREYSGGSRGLSGPSQRGTAEVSIDPSEITVNKYGIFSVNITVSDITDLYGWEFKLYWDNTLLNCTSAQIHIPDSWDENTDEAGGGIQNDFNATHGRYWKALSARYPATPFNGSMVVVSLTFEAKTVGNSVLDLQDTKLADVHAEAISHTAVDGSVNVLSQRYMRGDQHTVNNLNAYKLTVPQSAIYKTVSDGAAGRKTIYWGIRVWKRGSAGNETEITVGTPVAQVSRSTNGEGLQSNTWSCPQTSLQSTDAVVVRVYMKFGSDQWQFCSTFITEQLQASQLDSAQWTVHYYTWRFYDRWESITSGSYDWGTTTYNSHIQNFQYT